MPFPASFIPVSPLNSSYPVPTMGMRKLAPKLSLHREDGLGCFTLLKPTRLPHLLVTTTSIQEPSELTVFLREGRGCGHLAPLRSSALCSVSELSGLPRVSLSLPTRSTKEVKEVKEAKEALRLSIVKAR